MWPGRYLRSIICFIYFFFFVRKIFLRTERLGRWTDFDMRYTNRHLFTQGSAFCGLQGSIFTSSSKPKILGYIHVRHDYSKYIICITTQCIEVINRHFSDLLLFIFLSRISTLTRDIDIAIMSVRLSVRPSVHNVPVSDENGLIYRHSFFHCTVAKSF